MGYIELSLASAFIMAFIVLLVKYISKHVISNSDSFFFWTYASTLPIIIFIPFFQGFSFDISFIIPIFIHSLLLTSGQYLFSRGIYLVDASVVGPLFQLQSGLVVLLATIFMGEHYPFIVYTYLGLLIFGAMLVSVTDKTKLTGLLEKGMIYILGMQLLHAGANLMAGIALQHTTNWQVVFYGFLFNSFLATVFVLIRKTPIIYPVTKLKWFFLRAFLLILSCIFLYKAFETNLSISATLGLLSSPLVFVISLLSAKFFPELLEKQSRRTYIIRTLGMLIILFAAIQISLKK